eukprot:scaffold117822_cov20-Tisochrysis_lutea.AAC.1
MATTPSLPTGLKWQDAEAIEQQAAKAQKVSTHVYTGLWWHGTLLYVAACSWGSHSDWQKS